jgi:hypothetical protein
MKTIKIILAGILMFAGVNAVLADSPITSTPFYQAYYDGGIVTYAAGKKNMDNTIADYLANDNNPIDIRMAVINAMGWDVSGRNNTELYLTQVYEGKSSFDMNDLSAGQKLVIGYMTIMDDYFKPEAGLRYLDEAIKELPDSKTANIIYALAKGQQVMGTDFCEVWKVYDSHVNKSGLNADFSLAGELIVADYINIYKESCN